MLLATEQINVLQFDRQTLSESLLDLFCVSQSPMVAETHAIKTNIRETANMAIPQNIRRTVADVSKRYRNMISHADCGAANPFCRDV